MLILISLPSLLGVRLRSEAMMAFSISCIADMSYGCTTSKVDSGAETPAKDFSGVAAP